MSAAAPLPLVARPFSSGLTEAIRKLFSFPAMLMSGLVFLTVWSTVGRFDDPDLWWHLRLGQTIWDTGRIPASDQFSFTARGHEWVAHEWLSQVILFLTYHAGGYPALLAWLCIVGSSIVVLTYLLCSRVSGNWKVSLIGGILALSLMTVSLAIRPLLLGHLFLLVEMLLLHAGIERRSPWIWALPPLFIVWTNCHGSFLFGLLLLSAVVVLQCVGFEDGRPSLNLGTDQRRLLWLWMFCLAAPFVNPIGPALVFSPINVLLKQPDNIGSVEEWAPLTIADPRGLVLVLTLFAIVALALIRPKRIHWQAWVLLAGVTGMALQHERMLPIFGFVATPILCSFLAEFWDNYDPRRDFPAINFVLIVAAAVGCFQLLPTRVELNQQAQAKEPVAALAAMDAQNLPGPTLNDYVWGGYLLWARPSQPVFIDGRADIYAWTGVLREYGKWATLQEDPRLLLDRYHIRTCLLAASAPMAHVLAVLPEWKLAYSDNLAVVYSRRIAGE